MLLALLLMFQLGIYVRTSEINIEGPNMENTCPLGCLTCSKWNGCVDCTKNFTLHINSKHMRKTGLCLRECPGGFFKKEKHTSPGSFLCQECKAANCQTCGARDYCDICSTPYLEFKGTCVLQCPDNLHYSAYRRDCFARVNCSVSEWGDWSVCTRNGQTCGYKYGNQTRNRTVLEDPSPNGTRCPRLLEVNRCRMVDRHCNIDNTLSSFSAVSKNSKMRHKESKYKICRRTEKFGQRCRRLDSQALLNSIKRLQPTASSIDASHQLLNASSYFKYYQEQASLLKMLNNKKGKNSQHNRL